MFASWIVAINLRAIYNGSDAFARLSRDTLTGEANTQRLADRMKAFSAISTVAIGAAAVGMANLVKTGYTGAVSQIDAMTTASLNFNASLSQTAQLHDLISDTSNATAQSFTTTAEMASKMAQLSFTVEQTKRLFPSIARDADLIQFLSNGKTNPVDATKDIGQMAHLYGVYDTKGVGEIGRLLVGLSKTQPEDLAKVVTQSKYFAPLFSSLGVSPGASLAATAGMGLMGFLQSKGGTSAANAVLGGISATTLTGHLAKAKAIADQQSHLGLMDASGRAAFYDYNTKSFNLAGMMEHLAEVRGKYNANPALGGQPGFAKDLASAFGRGTVSYLLASLRPDTIKQVAIAQANMRKENVDADYAQEMRNPKYVQQLFGTNFLNTLSDTFTPLVLAVTPWMLGLANQIGSFDKMIRASPIKALFASIGLAVGSFALTLATAWRLIGPILGIAPALQALKAAPLVAPTVVGAGIVAAGGAAAEGTAGRGIVGRLLAGGAGLLAARTTNWSAVGSTIAKAWSVVPRAVSAVSGSRGLGLADGMEAFSQSLRGIFPAITSHVTAFFQPLAAIGARLLEAGAFLRGFGLVAARVGLQFVPFVNVALDVVLAVQAINLAFGFFRQHPKEIGTWVGNIIGYIRYRLIPDTVKIVESWGPLIGSAFRTIVQFMMDALNPAKWVSNFGGITDALQKAWQAGSAAVNQQGLKTTGVTGSNPQSSGYGSNLQRAPKAQPHAGTVINNHAHVTVNGATGADHQKLAKDLAKHIGAIQERHASKAVAANAGMSTSPWRPQIA